MNGTQFLKKLGAKHFKKPVAEEEVALEPVLEKDVEVEVVSEPAPEEPVKKASKSKKSK